MNNRNRKMCTLCLRTIHDREFYEIEEITRQMLEALFLHFNLEGNGAVMCIDCARKLQNAYDFKSTCVNIEKMILPFISEEDEKLKEDSFRENTNSELVDGFEDQKVCRFCMKMTENGCYTFLQEKKEHVFIVDMVQKYIPELHLNNTEEIVTCEACLIALQSLLNFITDCLDVSKKTRDWDETVENQLELIDVKELKHEFKDINIATEEKYNEYENNITVKDETSLLGTPELHIKDEETESFQNTGHASRDISEVKVYKCEKCSYDTKRKNHLKQHMLLHENFSEIPLYKCGTCLFHTKFKISLKRHMLLHQDLLDVTVYQCETCSYQTKFKHHLKSHMLVHQDVSDVIMYACEICSFKTKYKSYLKRHMLVHQNDSPYKCEKCSYRTKFKYIMKKHLWIHQRGVTVYQCDTCSYQTKFKHRLKTHVVVHQDPSNITMYECEMCSFKTKVKSYLKTHQDISVYKCEKCSYQTKFKCIMKKHMRNHRRTVYKCEVCSFQTKYKQHLKRHLLTHQRSRAHQNVAIYKCDICSCLIKFKHHFKAHMLVHQDLSNVRIFKCEMCSFQSKFQRSLKRHMVIHHNVSDTTIYKCEKCSFQSKYKYTLKRHLLTFHQDLSDVAV